MNQGGTLTQRMFCTGVLVRSNFVLTAQHCVRGKSRTSFKAVIGRSKVDNANQGQTRSIAAVYNMPGYGGNLDSDLTLLKLSSPSTMPTVPLAGPDVVKEWNTGKDIRAHGYGRTSTNSSPSIQQKTAVFRINTFTPFPANGGAYRAHEKMVATWTGRQLCKGDSGGPWTLPTSKGRRLVGISSDSYTYACNGQRGNVAMKVGFRGSVTNSPGYYWVQRCISDSRTCGTYPR